MRTFVVSAAAVFAVSLCSGGQALAQGFSDKICPEATQYVLAVGKLRKDDPPKQIYDASQAATDAYERCSKEKLSNGFREAQHYADTRAGQFAVVAARALVALNRPDDARKELQHWRPLVQQVVDWQAETETPHDARRPADLRERRGSAGLRRLRCADPGQTRLDVSQLGQRRRSCDGRRAGEARRAAARHFAPPGGAISLAPNVMRSLVVSSALALVVLAAPRGQASAQAGFMDVICPEATQYVVAAGKLRNDDPPQRVYDAAQAAANVYEQCSKAKLVRLSARRSTTPIRAARASRCSPPAR